MTSNIKHFPGTSLKERDFAEGKILFNHDELKGDFAWDTGVAIGAYLAGLKGGKILDWEALCLEFLGRSVLSLSKELVEYCFCSFVLWGVFMEGL